MPTVVDSFVVEFGLDPSKFTAGQKQLLENIGKTKEQAAKFGADLEAHGKRVSEFFTGLQRGAVGLLATYFGGAGLERVVQQITNMDLATGRLARTTGISARELHSWGKAFEAVGGSTDEARAQILQFQRQLDLAAIAPQQSDLPAKLRPLGINPFTQEGDVKRADKLLLEVMEEMDRRRFTASSKSAFLGQLGFSESTIQLALRGTDAVRKLLEEARKTAPTDDDIRRAEEYHKSVTMLTTAFENLGRALVAMAGPTVIGLMEGLTRLIESLRGDPNKPAEVPPGITTPWWLPGPGTITHELLHPGETGQDKPLITIKPWKALRRMLNYPEQPDDEPNEGFKPSAPVLAPNERIIAPTSSLRPGAAAVAMMQNNTTRGGDSTTTNSATVGQVVVNVPGGNSDDIARGVRGAIERHMAATQINYGQV